MLQLLVGSQTLKVLIDRPERVMVVGHSTGVVEMNCGKQDQRVTVGFTPEVNPTHGTEGSVRLLDYTN